MGRVLVGGGTGPGACVRARFLMFVRLLGFGVWLCVCVCVRVCVCVCAGNKFVCLGRCWCVGARVRVRGVRVVCVVCVVCVCVYYSGIQRLAASVVADE